MKLLRVALERQDYNLAAHVLVYGMIKVQAAPVPELKRSDPCGRYGGKNKKISNVRERSTKRQSKHS